MDVKQAYKASPQKPRVGTGIRRRRLLPFLSVLSLAAVGLGLMLTLDGFPFPESLLRMASARESETEIAVPTDEPIAPQLLTLSSGDIPLLQSLQERQALLEEREQQLATREEELRQLQQWIEKKLTTLTTLRNEIGALVEEREAFEEQRFEHLVKVYEGMKPAEAASLIERLNEDTAVKLFYRMKEKKVSQILGFIKPDVAAKLSERLAVHQKRTPSTSEEETQ